MKVESFSPRSAAVGGEDVALWNAMLSYRGQPLPLAGEKVRASFEPVDGPPPDGAALRARTNMGDGFILLPTRFPFKRLFGAEFSLEDLQTLPAALRDAFNEGLLALIWGALPDHALQRPSFVASGEATALAQKFGRPLTWFVVAISGLFPEPVEFVFGCELAALLRVLGREGLGPRVVWPELKTRLTRVVYKTVGQIILKVAQVRGLRAGDVVALPAEAQRHCLVGGSMFELADDGWMCRGVAEKGGNVADQELNEAGVSDLCVTLDFDIGQKTVSLTEIESWRPGALVQFDLPEPAPGLEIHVRTGGRLVAQGELVRIDDRLGVRLNKILIGTDNPG